MVEYFSREAVSEARRPSIELSWQDGSSTTVHASADPFSIARPWLRRGQNPIIKLGSNYRAVFQFPTRQAAASSVQGNSSIEALGRLLRAGCFSVYRLAPPVPPHEAPLEPPGLAARAGSASDLAGQPDVLFVEDFESSEVDGSLDRDRQVRHLERVSTTPTSLQAAPRQGPEGDRTRHQYAGLNMSLHFKRRFGYEPEEGLFQLCATLCRQLATNARRRQTAGFFWHLRTCGLGHREGRQGRLVRGRVLSHACDRQPLHGLSRIGSYVTSRIIRVNMARSGSGRGRDRTAAIESLVCDRAVREAQYARQSTMVF